VAELPGTHDLSADPGTELLREGVVDAVATAGLPIPGAEHPFVQPVPGVAEVQIGALAFAGTETIERNAEVLDADTGHWSLLLRLSAVNA
jgi:hypothetical protein